MFWRWYSEGSSRLSLLSNHKPEGHHKLHQSILPSPTSLPYNGTKFCTETEIAAETCTRTTTEPFFWVEALGIKCGCVWGIDKSGIILAFPIPLRVVVPVDPEEEAQPHVGAKLARPQEGIYPINLKLKQRVETQARTRRTTQSQLTHQQGIREDDTVPGHHLLRQLAKKQCTYPPSIARDTYPEDSHRQITLHQSLRIGFVVEQKWPSYRDAVVESLAAKCHLRHHR